MTCCETEDTTPMDSQSPRDATCKKGEASRFGSSTFNPNPSEAEAGKLCEFEASVVYTASSRTARATQRPCLNNQTQIKLMTKPCNYLYAIKLSHDNIFLSCEAILDVARNMSTTVLIEPRDRACSG